MKIQLESFSFKIRKLISSKKCKFTFHVLLMTGLMLALRQAFAADDPLAGTDASLIAALGSDGTARKFIYMIEGVAAIWMFIKTKNVMMLGGVVVIAIFFNVLFKVAGIA